MSSELPLAAPSILRSVLLFVLGMYPVPETFATADMAYGGAGAAASTTTAGPTTTAAAAGAMAVQIVDFSFDPADLTVAAGSTVDWVNNDTFDHEIVADDGSFMSEPLKPGDHYMFQFRAAGSFPYKCGIHPSMIGSVTVTA